MAQSKLEDKLIRVWASEVVEAESSQSAGTIISADKSGVLVACGENQLLLTELQLPGSRKMSVKDLLNAPKNQELLANGAQFS